MKTKQSFYTLYEITVNSVYFSHYLNYVKDTSTCFENSKKNGFEDQILITVVDEKKRHPLIKI